MSAVRLRTEEVRKEKKKRSIVRETRGLWKKFLTNDGVSYANQIRTEWTMRDKTLSKR